MKLSGQKPVVAAAGGASQPGKESFHLNIASFDLDQRSGYCLRECFAGGKQASQYRGSPDEVLSKWVPEAHWARFLKPGNTAIEDVSVSVIFAGHGADHLTDVTRKMIFGSSIIIRHQQERRRRHGCRPYQSNPYPET